MSISIYLSNNQIKNFWVLRLSFMIAIYNDVQTRTGEAKSQFGLYNCILTPKHLLNTKTGSTDKNAK